MFQGSSQGPGLLHYRLGKPIKGGNRGQSRRRLGAGLFKIHSSSDLEPLGSQEKYFEKSDYYPQSCSQPFTVQYESRELNILAVIPTTVCSVSSVFIVTFHVH